MPQTRWLTVLFLLACVLAGRPSPAADLPRLAVAGELRMGLGGVLLRAGLPFDYLTATEQTQPLVLARYDVILAAALEESDDFGPAALAAMDQYVRGGGHLFCELGWERLAVLQTLQVQHAGEAHEGLRFGLTKGPHPFLAELPAERAWALRGRMARLQSDDPAVTVLARFSGARWLRSSPALVARRCDKGEVLYTPTDIGYRQGNWDPLYEDLFVAAVAYLSGGRARPQWAPPAPAAAPAATAAAAPAATGYPKLESATDLGPALAEGYCLRVPVPRTGSALVFADWLPARHDGLVLEVRRGLAELTAQRDGRRLPPVRAALVPDTTEVVLQRLPAQANLVVDGAVRGSLPGALPAGRGCFARGGEALVQPLEAVWFADDFTGDGSLSGAWARQTGNWQLSGQTPAIAKVPGFALHGLNGDIAAGRWFWSQYRATVSVRPLSAAEVRLEVGRWDERNHLDLCAPVGQGKLRLVQVRGGQETTLADADAALPREQWTRLGLNFGDGRLTAVIDGAPVLSTACAGALGGIGLATRGGEAVFDDVSVSDDHEPAALPAVHPTSYDKGPEGLLDRDTWSCAAAAWLPEQAAHTFWHIGRFVGDFTWTVPLRNAGPAPRLVLHAGSQRGVPAPVLEVTGPHEPVRLERRDGRLSATVDGRPVAVSATPDGSLCLGLQWQDLALSPAQMELCADDVHEYLFDRAPVDWREAAGEWSVTSRWTCQPQWSWLTGQSDNGPAALWHKRTVLGDQMAQALLGPLMHGRYGPGCESFARLRLTICGDGQDPFSGYTIELGSGGQDVCTLYRKREAVAKVTDRLPRWREIHNAWFGLRLERHGADLAVSFHGRPLLAWRDPQPLPDGRVCLSTESNGVVTPYLAIYGRMGPPLPQR